MLSTALRKQARRRSHIAGSADRRTSRASRLENAPAAPEGGRSDPKRRGAERRLGDVAGYPSGGCPTRDDGAAAGTDGEREERRARRAEPVGLLDHRRVPARAPALSADDPRRGAHRRGPVLQAARAGARVALITANLRLVVKIAQEYRRAHRNILDLIQEGNIGLIHAVQKYDPYRGVKLSSYASWWIRAYILKFILANWRLVKVGTTQAQRKLFFNLRKEREKLEKQGYEVEAKHLAAALDVSEQEVVEMERRLNASETSLDAPMRSDEQGDRTQGDFVRRARRCAPTCRSRPASSAPS
jgi:RNA polymerase sigma-32 factor